MLSARSQSIYLGDIAFQARCALRAAASASATARALQQRLRDPTAFNPAPHREELFRSIHSMLTHASCISKMLWPIVPSSKRKNETKEEFAARKAFTVSRGLELRAALNIEETSPLKSRAVRDHLEHFDERLDDHARIGEDGWVLDSIGPLRGTTFERKDLLRWFDQTTGEFIIQGDSVSIPELAAALEHIRQALPEHHR